MPVTPEPYRKAGCSRRRFAQRIPGVDPSKAYPLFDRPSAGGQSTKNHF
ncbi:hypothetical protein D1BOALGB6SA_1299 [Olavius sp. associated proteobacterium Delta 1]|nr:hypothetical protein D1BOALGB6SA_1299 [Olavius sp. associated proteobacterium Delta 1]